MADLLAEVDDGMRKIGLGTLHINKTARRFINEVLDSDRLSPGKFVATFEREFAALHGCSHAIMCNSGTSALHAALAVLKELNGWQDGDEVLIPAITFIATANAVLHNNLVPVFVDVHPLNYTLDPQRLEACVASRTRAVLPVHMFGLPCDMDPVLHLVNGHGLKVIEDSAEAMFVRYKDRPVGSFGDMACFSTYVAHLLVSGIGGLITTNSEMYAVACRSFIAHGRDPAYLSIDDDDRLQDDEAWARMIESRFRFVRLGHNFRVTELEGALGLAQLRNKDEMMQRRRRNALGLIQRLQPLEDRLQLPTVPPGYEHAFMLFPIVLRDGLERLPLLVHLEKHGIETRYMMPLVSQPIYRQWCRDIEKEYPVAHWINRCGFYIGCHQGLEDADLDYIAEVIMDYWRNL